MFELLRIEQFVDRSVTELPDFCHRYQCWIEAQTKKLRPDLRYDNLRGDTKIEKARSLVIRLKTNGELAGMIYFLIVEYWLGDGKPSQRILHAGLQGDLCIAAQNLWRESRSRALARTCLDRLADLDSDFQGEWPIENDSSSLGQASWLGPGPYEADPDSDPDAVPFGSVRALTDHLRQCRQLYAQAREYRTAHQWLAARQIYDELNDLQCDYLDTPRWMERLRDINQVRALQAILDAAESGLAYDDRLPWEGDYPYRLFQKLDRTISPRASMETLQQALLRLTEHLETISADQRASLETLLKSEEQRLFVDAFLYPVPLAAEAARGLEDEFFKAGRLPAPSQVQGNAPGDKGVLQFLLGAPETALRTWETAQRVQLTDGQLALCQGLFHLGTACALKSQNPQASVASWRAAIAHWAIALADYAYWIKWGHERSQCYGRPFVFACISNLLTRLRERLERVLVVQREQLAAAGQTDAAAALGELQADLAIEFAAVRLTQGLGGIPIAPGQLAWFGPLGMAHYGQETATERFLREFVPDETLSNLLLKPLSPAEAFQRVRWYFSDLRRAAILLEGPVADPQGALDALAQVSDLTGDDAKRLTREAYWRLVRAQIKNGAILDRKALEAEWANALKTISAPAEQAHLLGRLQALVLEETQNTALEIPALSSCVSLIEEGLRLTTRSERPIAVQSLTRRLAERLAERGLLRLQQEDQSGAEADLLRALDLAPQMHEIRVRLVSIWHDQVQEVANADRFLALDYSRRAEKVIADGERKYPGYDYSEWKQWIQATQRRLLQPPVTPGMPAASKEGSGSSSRHWLPAIGQTSEAARLYGEATRELREGRSEIALKTLDRALVSGPDDVDIQATAAEAVIAHAYRLVEDGFSQEGLDLIKQWQPRLGTQRERMRRQWEFMVYWPEIRSYLKSRQGFVYTITSDPEVWMPFEAKNRDRTVVCARVEGTMLRLSALLPEVPIAVNDSAVRGLLRASREVLFARLVPGEPDPLLCCSIPFRLLDEDWFILAVYELSDLVDLSPDHLASESQLIDWFREIRASHAKRIGESFLSVSGKSIEKFCARRSWPFQRLTDVRYMVNAPFGVVELEAAVDGVRLSLRLASVREVAGGARKYHNLTEHNASLTIGKLSLTPDDAVVLSVELPYLDDMAAEESLEWLGQQVAMLRPRIMFRG